MVIALYFLGDIRADLEKITYSEGEKFSSLIKNWTINDLNPIYQNAIKHYIPDNNWRLVP